MTRLQLSALTGQHKTVIEAEHDVLITQAFNGVEFATPNDEHLAVSMRDGGYEVHYWRPGDLLDGGRPHYDGGWWEFKNSRPPHRLGGFGPDLDVVAVLEAAWGLIANAGGGNWETQTDDWQEAARRWRESYHRAIGAGS